MKKVFDEHEAESCQIFDSQTQQLKALIEEKRRIEAEMQVRVDKLKHDYRVYAQDLMAVAEGRERDLR